MRKDKSMRSKSLRDFMDKQAKVLTENCEFVHDESGKVVGGKAPNLKRIRDFYKKQARFNRLRKRK